MAKRAATINEVISVHPHKTRKVPFTIDDVRIQSSSSIAIFMPPANGLYGSTSWEPINVASARVGDWYVNMLGAGSPRNSENVKFGIFCVFVLVLVFVLVRVVVVNVVNVVNVDVDVDVAATAATTATAASLSVSPSPSPPPPPPSS